MNHVSGEGAGPGRGTLRSYAAGFIWSIVLTAIPFSLVMQGVLSRANTIVAIFSAAVVQMLVHLHYFLHMDTSSRARWNILALLFTALIMLLIVGGTLWIMYNLNYRLR